MVIEGQLVGGIITHGLTHSQFDDNHQIMGQELDSQYYLAVIIIT